MFAILDCNNFYASCERVFNPKLNGRPIVVLSSNDGCIIARSNEAKALGMKLGAPYFEFKALAEREQVVVFSSNYTLYGDMSRRVMNTVCSMVSDVEMYSIDEVFIDLSEVDASNLKTFAVDVREQVKRSTGIPVSIGIASTKTLAKIANHFVKREPEHQGALVLERASQIDSALRKVPVRNIWGVGGRTGVLLRGFCIDTAADLRDASDKWIRKHLSITGLRTAKELRGISCIPFEETAPNKKSICSSRSFGRKLTDKNIIREAVACYAARAAEKLRSECGMASLLMLFLRTDQFSNERQYQNSSCITFPVATNDSRTLIAGALSVLDRIYKPGYCYKKAGIVLSEIVPETMLQLDLFEQGQTKKDHALMHTVDRINSDLGSHTVRFGAQGAQRSKWNPRCTHKSPCYTTRWDQLLRVN